MSRRLLVTGGSGFLGWNVCAAAAGQWQVTALVNRHAVDIPGAVTVACDIANAGDLRRVFSEVNPDGVIHLAAMAQPNACQQRPDESRRINVEAAAAVAGLCAGLGIPCVFTSTDLVFDGTRPPYREEDPVSPISVYGEQKAAAETAMLDRCEQCTVCRMPLMFGDPGPAGASFVQPWITAFGDGRTQTLFTDEYRTPVSGRRAAAGLLNALGSGRRILHLGGRQRVSRYELGRLLARLMGVDPALVKPCLQRDVPMPAPRPADVSLDSSLAYAAGYEPGDLAEELRFLLSSTGRLR